MIEAKTKEIEAKCLSKAEIKELIRDDCSKNPCQNAKSPINRPSNVRRPGLNRRPAKNVSFLNSRTTSNEAGFVPGKNVPLSTTNRQKGPIRRPGKKASQSHTTYEYDY